MGMRKVDAAERKNMAYDRSIPERLERRAC
jgi:hypothetical protein